MGFGLIPAFGGIKESILRVNARLAPAADAFPANFVQPVFEGIAQAKVGTSAKEVIKLGYMRPTDGISLSEDFLLTDAKARVLSMVNANYSAPVVRPFKAFGQTAVAVLQIGTRGMVLSGMISEYDWEILLGIINIYAGGGVIKGAEITETYLEELERELFLKLISNQKTLDRILSMVTKGKPLRN
jgi:3-hydroxyacyl-CoA dehydrogenase